MIKKLFKTLFFLLAGIIVAGFIAIKFFGVNLNETVLDGLSGIKNISQKQVDWRSLDSLGTYPISHDIWNELTAKHVTPNGRVDYRGFWADSIYFQKYLELLSQNPPNKKNWSEAERLAYWINAYNAFTVKLILDNYPVKSIKELGGGLPFVNTSWDIKFFKLGGIDFDLNTIEHEILRKQFNEPRIHFAINCASISCPKLRNEAYMADRLEFQLEEQVQDFLLDKTKNIITPNKLKLSPLFDWFKVDFIKSGNLQDFVNRHYGEEISPSAKVEFLGYNWSLNE